MTHWFVSSMDYIVMLLPLLLSAKYSLGTCPELWSNIRGIRARNSLIAWLGEHTTSQQPFTSHSRPPAEGMPETLCLCGEGILSIFSFLSLSPFPMLPSTLSLSPTTRLDILIAVVTRFCRNKTGLYFSVARLHSPHSLVIP